MRIGNPPVGLTRWFCRGSQSTADGFCLVGSARILGFGVSCSTIASRSDASAVRSSFEIFPAAWSALLRCAIGGAGKTVAPMSSEPRSHAGRSINSVAL